MPASATRGCSPTAAGVIGMSVEHEPPPVAHDGGTAPAAARGLSVGHGPRHVARGRSPVATAPSL